jgi:dinuclear metal center YbgI/SA1388 family protein
VIDAKPPFQTVPVRTPIALILRDLDSFLAVREFEDYGPNGLQVPGAQEVRRVVTAVSCQRVLFERAAELEAELVLVHHGLFWNGQPPGLDAVLAERLRVLLRHDINLAAYHLPLDAHPEVGNNALLARVLGCAGDEPFGAVKGRAIGRLGRFAGDGLELGELVARVTRACGREPLVLSGGERRVRALAIVSGGGAKTLPEAAAAGADALLTGEPTEPAMAEARERGVHLIAAGHYATETFGVRALGERLTQRFGLDHVFVDLPNPV